MVSRSLIVVTAWIVCLAVLLTGVWFPGPVQAQCDTPAPDWYRHESIQKNGHPQKGESLHDQSDAVKASYLSRYGEANNLHVRSFAYQGDGCPAPPVIREVTKPPKRVEREPQEQRGDTGTTGTNNSNVVVGSIGTVEQSFFSAPRDMPPDMYGEGGFRGAYYRCLDANPMHPGWRCAREANQGLWK